MAEKPKRRRIFGPLTCGVLIASALVYVGFRLEPWVQKQLRCRTLLSELRTATGSNRWDKEQKLKDLIDPSTRYWVDFALNDQDPSIREIGYRLVDRAYPDSSQAIDKLLKTLADPAPLNRIAALESIKTIIISTSNNMPDCYLTIINSVSPLLRHQDPSTRIAALSCLKSLPREVSSIEETTASMMEDPDVDVRLFAIRKVDSVKTPAPIVKAKLESLLNNNDIRIRNAAAEKLVELESDRDRKSDYLKTLMRYPDPYEVELNDTGDIAVIIDHYNAIQSIVFHIGRRATIEVFVGMLNDSDPRIRAKAASVLGYMGGFDRSLGRTSLDSSKSPEEVHSDGSRSDLFQIGLVEALERKLDDPDRNVRFAAASALSSRYISEFIKDFSTIDPLLRAMIVDQDLLSRTRSGASTLLLAHSPEWNKDIERFFLKNLGRYDTELFHTILTNLSRRGSRAKPAIPMILNLCERFPSESKTALSTLSKIDLDVAERFEAEILRKQEGRIDHVADETSVGNGDTPNEKK